MKSFPLRPMTIRDYAAVLALWRGLPGIGLDEVSDSRAGIAQFLGRNPGLSQVACERGVIVGAVLCGHDGRRGYLHHLAVAESHQGRGIGRALVERCLAGLAGKRIPKCNIFLFRSNRKGRAFWAHNGWSLRGDLAVMQRKGWHPRSIAGRSPVCVVASIPPS